MKKSNKFSAVLAGAMALASLISVSAFADSRHQDETWRDQHRSERRDDRYDDRRHDRRRSDDRDFLSGTVERIDRRRGVVLLRSSRGRSVVVEMAGRGNRRGVDFADLRRGDYVTFVGDWSRGGFTAWRIDSVDSRRGRGRW